MSEPKIVKRYANRKLYDTDRSCYVTLEDISAMIKAGDDVRVIDNKSGEDLTTVTFAQIIFETEKKKSFMSTGLLRDLIQNGGDTIGGIARETVDKVQARAQEIRETAEKLSKETRETAEKLGTEWRERIDGVIHRKAGQGKDEREPLGKMARDIPSKLKIDELVKVSRRAFSELQQGVEQRVRGGVGAVSRYTQLDKEMDEIGSRLAALEERLEKIH